MAGVKGAVGTCFHNGQQPVTGVILHVSVHGVQYWASPRSLMQRDDWGVQTNLILGSGRRARQPCSAQPAPIYDWMVLLSHCRSPPTSMPVGSRSGYLKRLCQRRCARKHSLKGISVCMPPIYLTLYRATRRGTVLRLATVMLQTCDDSTSTEKLVTVLAGEAAPQDCFNPIAIQ